MSLAFFFSPVCLLFSICQPFCPKAQAHLAFSPLQLFLFLFLPLFSSFFSSHPHHLCYPWCFVYFSSGILFCCVSCFCSLSQSRMFSVLLLSFSFVRARATILERAGGRGRKEQKKTCFLFLPFAVCLFVAFSLILSPREERKGKTTKNAC